MQANSRWDLIRALKGLIRYKQRNFKACEQDYNLQYTTCSASYGHCRQFCNSELSYIPKYQFLIVNFILLIRHLYRRHLVVLITKQTTLIRSNTTRGYISSIVTLTLWIYMFRPALWPPSACQNKTMQRRIKEKSKGPLFKSLFYKIRTQNV